MLSIIVYLLTGLISNTAKKYYNKGRKNAVMSFLLIIGFIAVATNCKDIILESLVLMCKYSKKDDTFLG